MLQLRVPLRGRVPVMAHDNIPVFLVMLYITRAHTSSRSTIMCSVLSLDS